MTDVVPDARTRVFRFDESDDDALAPLPPPPRPQVRPATMRANTRQQRSSGGAATSDNDDDVGTPQSPPVPHEHPLAALSSNGHDGNTQRRSTAQRRAVHRLHSKRLDPAFFNPERISAILGSVRTTVAAPAAAHQTPTDAAFDGGISENDTPTLHSTRLLEHRIRAVERETAAPPELLEDELARAAIDASHWRHALHPLPVQTALATDTSSATSAWPEDSALERARVRKVAKQVDATWLQTQRDVANRPRAPLERDDERHVREQLVQTSARELLASGALFDATDAARLTAFASVAQHAQPLSRSGTIGLPGCCFDDWSR